MTKRFNAVKIMSMLSRLTLSILLFATLAMGNAAWATTYYADRLLPGSDSNNGTSEATPFLTVVKCAVMLTTPGDTCLVKNGDYPETSVKVKRSGTAIAPITLKNYPGHTPRLIWSDNQNENSRLLVQHANFVTGAPVAIQYVTIEGLELTGGAQAFKAVTAEFLVFRRNHVHHNGFTGVLCTFCYAGTWDRNYVHDNGGPCPACTAAGLSGAGFYIYGTGHVVTNNISAHNVVSGFQGSGYAFSSSSATLARQGGFNGYIANNLFAYNDSFGLVFAECEAGDSIVENNIFYENIGGSASKVAINIGCNGGQGGHIFRNNLAYATAPRGLNFIQGDTSSYTQTNNYCIPGSPMTCSGVATNPNMVNAPATMPASPNFHLKSPSQAINFGLNRTGYVNPVSGLAAPKADHDGVIRPTSGAWEVGAYGFSSDVSSPSAPQNLQVN